MRNINLEQIREDMRDVSSGRVDRLARPGLHRVYRNENGIVLAEIITSPNEILILTEDDLF